jgi:crotonobetaine/carnitine-CoA ligase
MAIAGQRTLYSILAAYAAKQPTKPWLIYEREDGEVFRWTYAEFLASVHQAANLLGELGIGPGDVVNLHLSNHPAYPQVILAASYLGAVVMPTNPVGTADELTYLLAHSESKAVITEARCLDVARKSAAAAGIERIVLCNTGELSGGAGGSDSARLKPRLPEDLQPPGVEASAEPGDSRPDDAITQCAENLPVYEVELARQSAIPPVSQGAAERVVQLLYTSGTTARPKGVRLTNANFVYGAEVFRAGSGLRQEDRHLIALPLFHAAAQCHALWPALIAGASVAILSRFSASRYFEQAATYDATMAALFGALLRMLLNQPERPADRAHRLRNVTFAQNLTPEQYQTWHRRFGAPLQQLWGMTETCGLPVMSPLNGRRNLLAMGRPVVGYEVKVVDDAGNEVALDEPGELIVRGTPGRTLMLDYLKNPDATAQTLRARTDGTWLYSGDTVRADADGFLTFIDRGRDLIKRAGENISSTEVESAILGCPGVLDACVVGLPDPIRDEAIVAVVVRQPSSDLTAEAIQAYCAQRLARFKVPERVEFVDALPRTSVGKIQKNLVRDALR